MSRTFHHHLFKRRHFALSVGLLLLVATAVWFSRPAVPVITITSNNSGPTSGGTLMIITGRGFTPKGDTKVWFGSTPATHVTVASASTIIATAPAAVAGSVSVTVEDSRGHRTSQPAAFNYIALKPVITTISPAHAPVAGGTLVTVHGHGFLASAVRVGVHTTLVAPAVADDATLTFIAPPMAEPGQVNVSVRSADGMWSSDAANFLYE